MQASVIFEHGLTFGGSDKAGAHGIGRDGKCGQARRIPRRFVINDSGTFMFVPGERGQPH